jgi:hypothetical protein
VAAAGRPEAARLLQGLAALPPVGGEAPHVKPTLDPEAMRRLRALGYIQ